MRKTPATTRGAGAFYHRLPKVAVVLGTPKTRIEHVIGKGGDVVTRVRRGQRLARWRVGRGRHDG